MAAWKESCSVVRGRETTSHSRSWSVPIIGSCGPTATESWDLPPTPSPEARYERRETISLAFIAALQLLPPRQRAALILTDVLDFSAREVADMLDSSEHAIYGAVKRARATLTRQLPRGEPPPLPK